MENKRPRIEIIQCELRTFGTETVWRNKEERWLWLGTPTGRTRKTTKAMNKEEYIEYLENKVKELGGEIEQVIKIKEQNNENK